MIKYNQRAMPVHREPQLGKFISRDKYSVECRRLWSLTRFPRGCRFAPLKYLCEVRLVDPVSHGPILSHRLRVTAALHFEYPHRPSGNAALKSPKIAIR